MPQAALRQSRPSVPDGGAACAKNILVVDDSIVLRSILRTALLEEKFVVFSARDAAEALICLDQNDDIDLIISDFHMPGLDGAGFIEQVRRHDVYSAVPVLVLTAGADDMEKQRARDAGASGWIVKPFDTAKLAAAIHQLTPERRKAEPAQPAFASHRAGSKLRVRYERHTGLIHTLVDGPTDRQGVEDYLYAVQTLQARAREEWGRCWHLVDARGLEMQSAEALGCLSGASLENFDPTDRTAVVMTSSRAITQMQDMPSQLMSRIFPDIESATNWLLRG